MMMMMMMMMMNCFCGLVDRRKAFSLTSSRDHSQISSPSRISDTPRAGFGPAQNLGSGFVEWSCAVVITTTPRRHCGKCEKLGGFIAEHNFRFFYKENDGISLETRFLTALAKVNENVFQGLWVMNNWCKCLKIIKFHENRILVSFNFLEEIFKLE